MMRNTAAVLPVAAVHWLGDRALVARISLQEIERHKKGLECQEVVPILSSIDGENLKRLILNKHEPWRSIQDIDLSIPNMLSPSERQYYSYVSNFYKGTGEVVEIGPWLGGSTYLIISSLLRNPNFEGKNLYVFDDFVWRSAWMNKWLDGTSISPPDNFQSFEDLFTKQVEKFLPTLEVSRGKLSDYDGNESLPVMEWNGNKIEMIFVDCGRSYDVNQSWWKIFSPYFIEDVTLVIMQDWQCFKRVPEIWWENTKMFTDSKDGALDLVHEIRDGTLATFVYRG